MDQGQQAVNDAMLAWKDAQIATHEARYDWRDLLEAAHDLDNEDYREKTMSISLLCMSVRSSRMPKRASTVSHGH